jgi:hypothetical protein
MHSLGRPTKKPYTTTIQWGIHQINARPFGNGYWGETIQQTDSRVEAYELMGTRSSAKINPAGESFYLPHPNGGFVQFENLSGMTVQDGKLITKLRSIYHVTDVPYGRRNILAEAQRQEAAAQHAGYTVEWLVSDAKAVTQLQQFFRQQVALNPAKRGCIHHGDTSAGIMKKDSLMKYIDEEYLKQILAKENPVFQTRVSTAALSDDNLSTLLQYYLFLTEYPNAVHSYLPELSEADLLYNRYYWFLKFKTNYGSKRGDDAGLDQQAFQLIEEIDQKLTAGVNWSIIQQIEKHCGWEQKED